MNILCDKYLFSDAIDGVSKAVSFKSTLPILEGILIEAKEGLITLTGYNLEIGITTSIEANIIEEGSIVLSSKLLCDIVRKLDSEEVSIKSNETYNTVVKGGTTEFNLVALNPFDYPFIPSINTDHAISLEGGKLKNMISSTIFAVSQNDKKPAHTGELFVLENNTLSIIALDGFRLAICIMPIETKKEISLVIPQKTMHEVSALIVDEKEEVIISANNRYIIFNVNNYTIVSRLIEDSFLDYQKVIPKDFKTTVVANTKEIGRASCRERVCLYV